MVGDNQSAVEKCCAINLIITSLTQTILRGNLGLCSSKYHLHRPPTKFLCSQKSMCCGGTKIFSSLPCRLTSLMDEKAGVASHLAYYTCDVTIINYQPSSTLNICRVHHVVLWFNTLLFTI